MKKVLAGIVLATSLLLSGCSSLANHFEKTSRALTASDYLVVLYSGGKPVHYWIVRDKFINTEQQSDGYFWVDHDQMIRVSGDVVIQEIKGLTDEQAKKQFGLQ
jgi:hypothetical protein